jgi:hypothetical protein
MKNIKFNYLGKDTDVLKYLSWQRPRCIGIVILAKIQMYCEKAFLEFIGIPLLTHIELIYYILYFVFCILSFVFLEFWNYEEVYAFTF